MAKPNKKTINALTPVLAWLDAGARHVTIDKDGNEHIMTLDMSEFVGYVDCGAVCCIAGAADQFNKLGVYQNGGTAPANVFRVAKELGMTVPDAFALFFAKRYVKPSSCWIEEFDSLSGVQVFESSPLHLGMYAVEGDFEELSPAGSLSGITPEDAAKALRSYLETGKVVWS